MRSVLVAVIVVMGAVLAVACPPPPADLWNQVQAQYQNLRSFSAEILNSSPELDQSFSETFVFCSPFVRWSRTNLKPVGRLQKILEILHIENIQTGQAWILYKDGVWEEITDEARAGRHQVWLEWLGIRDLVVEEVSVTELDRKQFWLIKGRVEREFKEVEARVLVDCDSLLITRVDLKGALFTFTKTITNFSPNVEVDPELFTPPPEELITRKVVIVPEGRAILSRVWDKLRTLNSFIVRKRVEDEQRTYEEVVVYRYPYLRKERQRPVSPWSPGDVLFVTIIDFSSGVVYDSDSVKKFWTKEEIPALRLPPESAFYRAILAAFPLSPAASTQPIAVEEKTWQGRKVWLIVERSHLPEAPPREWWVDQETLTILKYTEFRLICRGEECHWRKNEVVIVGFEANPEIPAELFALLAQAKERRVPRLPGRPKPREEPLNLAPPLLWEPFSFSRLEEAKVQGKGVVLYFSAEWCEPCQRLEAGPFRDSRVQEVLGPFVLLKVDLTEYLGEARKAAETFRVRALPTLVFLSPEGKELGRIRGYSPRFFADIQRILGEGEK